MALLEANAKYHGLSADGYAAKYIAGIETGAHEVPEGALQQAFHPDQEKIVREAGGEPVGIQEGFGKHPALALFNDPQSKTGPPKLSIPVQDVPEHSS